MHMETIDYASEICGEGDADLKFSRVCHLVICDCYYASLPAKGHSKALSKLPCS